MDDQGLHGTLVPEVAGMHVDLKPNKMLRQISGDPTLPVRILGRKLDRDSVIVEPCLNVAEKLRDPNGTKHVKLLGKIVLDPED